MFNKRRFFIFLGIILVFIFVSIAITVYADSPGEWPEVWYSYPDIDGNQIYDPADQSPADSDIISVPGIHPSVFVTTDGDNIFFRMRLRGDPRQSNRFSSHFWLVEIAAQDEHGDFVHVCTAGLHGGNPSTVYVTPAHGIAYTPVYTSVSNDGNMARAFHTNDGYNHYFLDFQVPISSINLISGQQGKPIITGSTPVRFFFGTSTNPNSIGKDFMTGAEVTFDNVATATLEDIKGYLAPEIRVGKTGPEEINAGTKITYSLTVENLGSGDASNVIISDHLPADITNAEYSLNHGNSW